MRSTILRASAAVLIVSACALMVPAFASAKFAELRILVAGESNSTTVDSVNCEVGGVPSVVTTTSRTFSSYPASSWGTFFFRPQQGTYRYPTQQDKHAHGDYKPKRINRIRKPVSNATVSGSMSRSADCDNDLPWTPPSCPQVREKIDADVMYDLDEIDRPRGVMVNMQPQDGVEETCTGKAWWFTTLLSDMNFPSISHQHVDYTYISLPRGFEKKCSRKTIQRVGHATEHYAEGSVTRDSTILFFVRIKRVGCLGR